jgi:CBS domain-containing protein
MQNEAVPEGANPQPTGRRELSPSYGLRCADVMAMEVALLEPGETVAAASRKMRALNLGFLPVCSPERRLLGVVTDRDLTLRVIAEELPFSTPVEEVMSLNPIVCPSSAELELAEGLMRAHRKMRIACVDEDGRLAGVLTLADIARFTAPERAGDLLSDLAGREVTASRQSSKPRF